MSELYEDLMAGFNEIHESIQSGKELKTTILTIPEVKHYSKVEIKEIRQKTGMTQALFAYYMGVSKKTVEAWEHGTNHPTGPACRILYYLESGEMVKVP